MSATAIVRLAEAVLPVPPLVELTAPLVLLKTPVVAPVTFTVTVQDEAVAIVPPLKLMLPEPAVAVAVPTQVPPKPFGVATTSPVGSVSVNATPASATVLAAGLVSVKVSVETPFTAMAVGLNAFAMEGGATTTMDAEAVPPVPPSVEVMSPVVLFWVPGAMPTTFTENVHEPPAGSVPPERFTTEKPEMPPVVMVPAPQEPVRPLGVATFKPAGSVSPKPMPVNATVAFGLVTVKVSVVVPFSGMLAAPNALVNVGGAVTVRVAVEVLPVPLSLDVTVTLLTFAPPVVGVTFTLKVHDAEAARVAPDRLTVDEPAAAVMVPPPHEPVRPFGVETTRPAGNESVNATPVSELPVFGLLMVKLSALVPFNGTAFGLNDFVICAV
jgi:hypothetical protein